MYVHHLLRPPRLSAHHQSDFKFGNTWCAERFLLTPSADVIATPSSYANSVLQALYFCNPFRELLLQLPDPSARPESSIAQATQASQHLPLNTTTTVRRRPERKYSVNDPRWTSETSSTNVPTLSGPHIPSMPRTLSSALRSLFVHISKHPGDKGTVAPRAFIEKLKELNELFRSSMHQDAHEFLNYLLNRIVEEIEEVRKRAPEFDRELDRPRFERLIPPYGLNARVSVSNSLVSLPASTGSNSSSATIVHRLFEGVLTSETRCLTCETVSSRDESFLDLSIDIEQNSSVTACLRQFSASEMLCQKNKFFCDGCCDLQEAEKRMKIKKLPNVLALHLKRFKYQEELQKYIKLTYRVAFPMELRLFNTVDDTDDPDRLYELYAIVVHIGKYVISPRDTAPISAEIVF
jgi:ubiquitin carboxyl-terminal hydrolase 9/13